MNKLHTVSLAVVGTAMYMLGQAQVSAGNLGGEKVTAETTYEFTDCQRPEFILSEVVDRESYQKAILQYNLVVGEANAYFQCIQAEAQRDIDIHSAVIKQAYTYESERVKQDLTEMRNTMSAWSGSDPEPVTSAQSG